MYSLWKDTAKVPHFDSLKGDIKTDVLIIGGGITGILCAYMLKHAGIDYVLAEKDNICGGITQNTTAKITVQHGLIYDKIIRKYGTDAARQYYEANNAALEMYKTLCRDIDCDFTQRDSTVYSVDSRKKIEDEIAALDKIGVTSEFCSELPLPVSVSGAVTLKNQAQFDPLKFLFCVAKDLNIYENTKISELKPNGAVTQNGIIKANRIIVATHFPFINKHGSYFLKLYQHRSYVLALKNAMHTDGMFVDEDEKGLSFRGYADFLLLGGGSHRTGKNGGNFSELKNFAAANFPEAEIVYKWATQDCMSLDGIPYIGQYSKNTPNFYVSTGFNKWGMTSAMTAAMLLTDLIQGKENPYLPVFSPSRTIISPQLAINGAEAVLSLITPTAPRCPHMGCALKYNRQEHSWDCPCHGSRFTEKGRVINNPATDNLKLK